MTKSYESAVEMARRVIAGEVSGAAMELALLVMSADDEWRTTTGSLIGGRIIFCLYCGAVVASGERDVTDAMKKDAIAHDFACEQSPLHRAVDLLASLLRDDCCGGTRSCGMITSTLAENVDGTKEFLAMAMANGWKPTPGEGR